MTENKTGVNAPEKKSKGKGTIVTVAVIAAIAGGTGYAALNGLIPGLESKEKKAVESLKADLMALQGDGLEEKLKKVFSSAIEKDTFSGDSEKAGFKSMLNDFSEKGDISLSFKELSDAELEGNQAVKMDQPQINLDIPGEGISGSAKYGWYKIFRDTENSNRYKYIDSGKIELFANMGGQEQKLGELRYEPYVSEMIVSDDFELEYSKGGAKNLEVVEGRGGTVLLKVAEMNAEQSIKSEGDQVDAFMKAEYKGIEAGDMIKMMIGAIEPIDLTIDASYKGDEMGKIAKVQEDLLDGLEQVGKDITDGMKDEVSMKKPSVFKGDLNVNDFSLMMGGAGFKTNADLAFGSSATPIPSGKAQLTLANYEQLISTILRFVPAPQEDVDNGLNFLKAIGEEKGQDIVFNFAFDGTENVLLGGKTMNEIEEIQKSFEGATQENEAVFQQSPVSSPEVQTKELVPIE